MMKKKSLALSAAILMSLATTANAQVKDVSVTVSPVVGHTWWHNDLNLGNTAYWGVRAGFGFGPILELRGVYEKSFDLKGKLKGSSWGALNNLAKELEDANVRIERMGGELKVNLWSGTILTPYVTAGAGVMNFKYDDLVDKDKAYKEEQLYGTLGAGAKINLTRRLVLSLEGKNLLFNVDKRNRYLVDGANPERTLQNWNAQASLDFYLGGTRRYETDAVSRAYRNAYSDGFRGLKFVIEPGAAFINFDDQSRFRDQWFIGGSAGVDFNSLVGVRGFYYRANEKANELNFKTTDDLQLYGGNLIARLNFPRGVTPYLSLGAGYMDVKGEKYIDKQGTNEAKSGWFAMGGAGLDIPLHRMVSLYGSVNAILNEQDNLDPQDIYTPNQVKANMMYTAGVRFNFGAGASSRSGKSIYEGYIADARSAEREANMAALNELRAKYDDRIAQLNEELEQATADRDANRVARLLNEKAAVKSNLNEVETRQEKNLLQTVQAESNNVVLTTSQFEDLVRRVVSEVKGSSAQTLNNSSVMGSSLSDLDKILLINALGQAQYRQLLAPAQVEAPAAKAEDKTDLLLKRIEALTNKVEALDKKTNEIRKTPVQVQLDLKNDQGTETRIVSSTVTNDGFNYQTETTPLATTANENLLNFKGITLITGPNFGDQFNWNVGVRPLYQIGNSGFTLAPEAFIGFGSNTGYGVSANALYGFVIKAMPNIRPYAGLGLGYTYVGKESRFGTNVILGAQIAKVLGGEVSIDYSIRNAFKNNQIALGYTISL